MALRLALLRDQTTTLQMEPCLRASMTPAAASAIPDKAMGQQGFAA
jgi:hypothetical protein